MKKTIIIFLLLPMALLSQNDYEKGVQLFEKGKLLLAKPLFESFLKANSNHTKTIEYLGDIESSQKKWDNAIFYYNKLKTQFPKNANYWYKYGGSVGLKAKESNKFKALGMIDDIENAFLTSAKLDPKHTDTRWALLMLYLELPSIIGGSEKKAQKYADELMAISKIDGVMAKGHIEEHNKRYKQAEVLYKQGVEITHSKTAYQRLINLYKKMKDFDKAKLAQQESDSRNK
jgi:tetratricopeptide (TPR) repeat protein